MKRFLWILGVLTILILPSISSAQVDHFGVVDTIYADVAKINDANWSITINYTNDEAILGLSVPLKLTAGAVKIVADSAVYVGGRVEHFAYKSFRPDTVIQCVTLGMIANLGPTKNVLAAGRGRLATIFVSSLGGKTIEKLGVDTTTTSPNNSLMVIADRKELEALGNDSIPAHLDQRGSIYPAFKVLYAK
ncbi:MAG: hypothetical protein KOO62_02770 [candidate division Zixibacteria bacterium]|nr:hypothetical protein [candidate division Zixibacteria bacterium]